MTSEQKRILSSMVLINFVGAFIIFFYFAYIDLETLNANKAFWRGSQLDWSSFAVVMVLLGVTSALVAWGRYGRVLDQWASKLLSKVETHAPQNILRWAATYPIIIALISFILWVISGVFFAQGGLMFGTADARTFWRTFIGIVAVGGLTASTLIYLMADNVWQNQRPLFLKYSDLRGLKTIRISVGQRLVATFLLTGLVPLIILGTAARNSVLDAAMLNLDPFEVLSGLQNTVIFVVIIGIISNLLLSLLTTQSLLRPLRQLVESMKKVGRGDLTQRVPVTANDEIGDLTIHFNEMIESLEQGQKMRDIFGRYVSREVAEQALAQDGANLGGKTIQATALFADIRNFTTLSEKNPPEVVVDILNRYYTKMVDAIINEGGMVNKFGGDSLLAVFGAPIRQPDHALRAVRAAWQMNRALAEFNAEQMAQGLPPISIGVGISSGDMVAGNVGAAERMEYTVIGDPVNLAARLESLTKQMQRTILISEHTQRLLEQNAADLEVCDSVTVKGKSEPTMVYAVRNIAHAAA